MAKALYGEISDYSATRLERFAACAFAHFLKYGLAVTERAEYEFRAMDMGNVLHQALERFAAEIRRKGLDWRDLRKKKRPDCGELYGTGDGRLWKYYSEKQRPESIYDPAYVPYPKTYCMGSYRSSLETGNLCRKDLRSLSAAEGLTVWMF